MSKKVSMETLLPIALELYKGIPSVAASIKPSNAEERTAKAQIVAEEFASFCHLLRQKLEVHGEL